MRGSKFKALHEFGEMEVSVALPRLTHSIAFRIVKDISMRNEEIAWADTSNPDEVVLVFFKGQVPLMRSSFSLGEYTYDVEIGTSSDQEIGVNITESEKMRLYSSYLGMKLEGTY